MTRAQRRQLLEVAQHHPDLYAAMLFIIMVSVELITEDCGKVLYWGADKRRLYFLEKSGKGSKSVS